MPHSLTPVVTASSVPSAPLWRASGRTHLAAAQMPWRSQRWRRHCWQTAGARQLMDSAAPTAVHAVAAGSQRERAAAVDAVGRTAQTRRALAGSVGGLEKIQRALARWVPAGAESTSQRAHDSRAAAHAGRAARGGRAERAVRRQRRGRRGWGWRPGRLYRGAAKHAVARQRTCAVSDGARACQHAPARAPHLYASVRLAQGVQQRLQARARPQARR